MSGSAFLEVSRERPRLDPRRLRKVRPRDMVVRFTFGAATSVLSAFVSLEFGPRAGGVLLAFPAILAASVTLIARKEGPDEACEAARGAMVGAIGLACFAAVGALLFGRVPGAVVLALAGGAWALAALGIYRLVWWRA
jgi:Protein of unknown function (DUF3147)